MTDKTLVEMRWKWFTPQLLYINYDKIESIEVRTPSWMYSVVGISDVRVHLAGDEYHTLVSAEEPKNVVQFLQDKLKKDEKKEALEEDKEPFDVLVDALSWVVKDHLTQKGKSYINRDYIEKLDSTLSYGTPIDLRSEEEKMAVQNWKQRHIKTSSENL